MGKVDDMRALREARYGRQRDRRPVGLVSREPVLAEAVEPERPEPEAPAVIVTTPPSVDITEDVAVDGGALASASVKPGRPIHAYKQAELEAIVAGLYQPGMTVEQMIDAVCAELGFLRRGKIIKARVREAFEARCAA